MCVSGVFVCFFVLFFVCFFTVTNNHDADDEPIDTNDTGKDHRDNTLHHKLRLHHTHAGDTHRALGCPVG